MQVSGTVVAQSASLCIFVLTWVRWIWYYEYMYKLNLGKEWQKKAIEHEMKYLDSLTDEERVEILFNYCSHCGCLQPWHPSINDENKMGCQCWNDE